jgi:hypothetical protein
LKERGRMNSYETTTVDGTEDKDDVSCWRDY